MKRAMKRALIFIIKIYKMFISPYIGRSCRYVPSCSEYAIEAVEKFGFTKGLVLSAKRILRCQPFCKGGYDPAIKERE